MLARLFDCLSKLGLDHERVILNTGAVITRNVCRKKAFGAVDVAIFEAVESRDANHRRKTLRVTDITESLLCLFEQCQFEAEVVVAHKCEQHKKENRESASVHASNENKISHRWRQRA
jgi:hypothetical protein